MVVPESTDWFILKVAVFKVRLYSSQQDHHLLTRVLFYSWKSFNQVVVAADVVSFIIENDSG